MAPRGNNMVPNGHFHKCWKRLMKIKFNQHSRKMRRKRTRVIKLKSMAPQPIELLRPIVRCPTFRYNVKIKAGRGFTLQELKAADINAKLAKSMGIAVDHRRTSRSMKTLLTNVQRLKNYKHRLILLSKNKPKVRPNIELCRKHPPLKQSIEQSKARIPSEEEKKFRAFTVLRKARLEKCVKKKNLRKARKEGIFGTKKGDE